VSTSASNSTEERRRSGEGKEGEEVCLPFLNLGERGGVDAGDHLLSIEGGGKGGVYEERVECFRARSFSIFLTTDHARGEDKKREEPPRWISFVPAAGKQKKGERETSAPPSIVSHEGSGEGGKEPPCSKILTNYPVKREKCKKGTAHLHYQKAEGEGRG